MLELVFFVASLLVIYHYVGYPVLIIGLARLFGEKTRAASVMDLPSVTVIIAAYNEEKVIKDKIENTLSLDYPAEKLKVMVVADGSSDATADIARGFSSRGVIVLHETARRGKTPALNRGVAATDADIILFSDANNHFNKDAIRRLVERFQDPRVGGACGLKQIYDAADRESSVGDSLYWKYESAIKLAESRLGSITTADGEIFAVRRSLYRPLDERLINDDAAITFDLIKQGYRVVYEPGARSYEHASIRIEDDFFVKVRMVAGGFQTLSFFWRDLLPPRSAFALTFLSHKFLRWTAPELLILIAITSIALSAQPLFLAALLLQIAFYTLAAIGWFVRHRPHMPKILYVPFYFCTMNLAALLGLIRFLRRRQSINWRKAQR